MKKTSAIVSISLEGVPLPNLTEISRLTRYGSPGLMRMSDICLSGVFDDAGAFPGIGDAGESRDLVIKVGRKRFSVPVVVMQSTMAKKRRGRARWQVTMMQAGPGAWAGPKKRAR